MTIDEKWAELKETKRIHFKDVINPPDKYNDKLYQCQLLYFINDIVPEYQGMLLSESQIENEYTITNIADYHITVKKKINTN